ncbi:sigma-54 dependent transcriptional regulator [Pseudodesulfovibrio thermohalotolerans]|uniref:sigma-54-dependent transcriptional regulator n=1 Tax=Pseudodesulfovibrio thermohalotolerans TaxID=2880651 RepID=UPI002440F14B|nr:sigma-54 dependent transcriptional regulator [Pseudodesulfovibrio thermohalotolerans]WFS63096.1 sigma-54 dependent transcriptional regulator [Pseudodesulfovibrio thermohalotolerans]
MSKSIILVEDELSIRIGMQHTLSAESYLVESFEDADSALQAMGAASFDLLITDMRLPGISGLELIDKVKELHPSTGTMLITAFPEIELAVSAMRHGAFDFLCKPFSNEGLLIAVERYFNYHDLRLENTRLKTSAGLDAMIGGQAMQPVFERIRAVADACTPVLVLGPSGTGKELVANALHTMSSRSGKPFIKVNCSALPEQLLESELFGHEKGAFTGAHKRRIGKFEAANQGTFFFDEVGDMPLALQVKLLRVLEDGEITRVGGNTPIKVDVRTIFATAKDIDKALEEGSFREDLYYRINVVPINLPPLRERGDDKIKLMQHFLRLYADKHRKEGTLLSPEAQAALMVYDFPGNIRELRNIMERSVLLAQDGVVRLGHLPQRVLGEELDSQPGKPPSLEEGVREYERKRIVEALEQTGNRKQLAAGLLGISRKVLWKKLKELGISA